MECSELALLKGFTVRLYHNEGFASVEIGKINDLNTLISIVNFLERLREG